MLERTLCAASPLALLTTVPASSRMSDATPVADSAAAESGTPTPSFLALTPLFLFLALFFGVGLLNTLNGIDRPFSQLEPVVAVLPALVLSVLLGAASAKENMRTLVRGIGDETIITMAIIFLLAGAFATVMEAIGGVEATVNLGLSLLPAAFILPGLFVISAFISLSMGTSMGTLAAVAPIAVGVSGSTELSGAITLGAVVGGAMFGDNLSIISDTTIAATRTQGCSMTDKFRANLWIAVPAAVITTAVLFFMHTGEPEAAEGAANVVLVLPYLIVLALAVAGLDVFVVLGAGTVLAGITGMATVDYRLMTFAADIYAGFESMFGIMILAMFIGGMGELIRKQGGLAWLAQAIQRATAVLRLKGRRAGEAGIGAMAALSDVLIANNTVAILLSGTVARDLADRYDIDAPRSASLLDVFACVMQGVLPYGGQVLLAASLAEMAPTALVGAIHYCWALLGVAILSIAFQVARGPGVTTAPTSSAPASSAAAS